MKADLSQKDVLNPLETIELFVLSRRKFYDLLKHNKGLEDAADELKKMEDVEKVRREMEKGQEKPMNQKMFRAI